MKRILHYILTLFLVTTASFVGYSYYLEKSQEKATIQFRNQKQLTAYIEKKIESRENGNFKQDKPDKYLEYFNFLKSAIGEDFSYKHNQDLKELELARQHRALLKSAKVDLDWKERGPGNVGGRTRGFILDPDDSSANTWFAGSVGGGIWKTTDAGDTWVCITSDWPNLSISTMAMAESNHNIIYAGTGEGFGNVDAILGNGIFKSNDKGQTWTLLAATAENRLFTYTNRIVIHPQDEKQVFAATNTGIFRSIDGGISWIEVYSFVENGYYKRIQDLRINPDNPFDLVATVNDRGIVRSEDGGNTWKLVYSIEEGRIEVNYSTKNTNYIYALSSESNLYLSTDGGDNWQQTETSGTKVQFLSGQGWYNNTLFGDLSNENVLLVGGLDVHKVTIGKEQEGTGNDVFDVSNGTFNYFTFGDIDGEYLMGGLDLESLIYTDLSNLEIRFGSGKTQKAHFFTVNASIEGRVAAENYLYVNYVDVPFEVWDKENNIQLMVSVRDQNENGEFDLSESSLEQIHIHNIVYDSSTASAEIGQNGGVSASLLLTLYPKMKEGVAWQPSLMEDCVIGLEKYALNKRAISSVQKSDWSKRGQINYSHADHHNLVLTDKVGSPYRLINCNDGGVFMTDDLGSNWVEKTNGYVTSQFYGVSKHPEYNVYLGGTQDNGTWVSGENSNNLSAWQRVAGGDGFETVWHSIDENKLAVSLYYNTIYITSDGQNFKEATLIGDKEDNNAPFITRISNSYSNSDLLLVGGESGIWRSPDFGESWKLITMPSESWSYGQSNPQMEISPVSGQIVWGGSTISSTAAPAVSIDGGLTFNAVNSPNESLGRTLAISNIVAHPTESETAFLLFAVGGYPKIYKTEDLGQSWTELSGFGAGNKSTNGFPDVAVYDMIVMPHNTDIIWAGTEIGLFESTDGGENWLFADNGLPAVCIWDMKIVGQQVVVGTHGRGVWTLDLPDLPFQVRPPYIEQAAKKPNGEFWYSMLFPQDFDSIKIYVEDELWEKRANVIAGEETQSIIAYLPSTSRFEIKVIGYLNKLEYVSNLKTVENPSFDEVVEKYTNSFSTRKSDFNGSYFKISNKLFNDYAVNTAHPYAEGNDYTYVLKYPIMVLDDAAKATLSYRDIALVEPGEFGTVFGDEEFWDYVVVEGTKDGVNWMPLADGYDVNYSSKWTTFVDDNDIETEPDSKDLFVDHSINLHDTFDPGDVILIRFRLYSDAASIGWGWVIDDVVIQSEGTGIFTPDGPDGSVNISPNPAGEFINIELDSREIGDVQVIIYSLSGKKDFEQSFTKNTELWKERIEIANLNPGMKLITVIVEGKVYSNKFIKK